MALDCDWQDGLDWIAERRYLGDREVEKPVKGASVQKTADDTSTNLPDWAYQPAPEEARPPRPLTPSDLGPDNASSPPPDQAMRDAARRGRYSTACFSDCPTSRRDRRNEIADRWLEQTERRNRCCPATRIDRHRHRGSGYRANGLRFFRQRASPKRRLRRWSTNMSSPALWTAC